MNYQPRNMQSRLTELADYYPVLVVCGPRQSGKSTLVKQVFNEYRYVSLEDIDERAFATEDPRGFLEHYFGPVIIDEVQQVPTLFSYVINIISMRTKMQRSIFGEIAKVVRLML